MPIVENTKGEPFPGQIGRTADESSPAWPALTRAQLDDVAGVNPALTMAS